MNLYLISGKAGSGKDEVAHIIKDHLPNTVITSLSKYIKLIVKETTDWDGNDETKPRELLQKVGDYMRAEDKNYLTERIKKDLNIYQKLGINNVIVSDVRLLNEIEYFKNIKEINTILIRVNAKTSKRYLTNSEKEHSTEIELDNYNQFDYIINNDFNNELYNDVIKILEGMK